VVVVSFELRPEGEGIRQRTSADVPAERKPSRLLEGLNLAAART